MVLGSPLGTHGGQARCSITFTSALDGFGCMSFLFGSGCWFEKDDILSLEYVY